MPNQTPYAMPRYNPATNRPPNVRILGQPPGGVAGVPGAQPLLPSTRDPTRQPGSYQGQPMQMSRMNHPRVPVPPNYGGMRPPPNSSVAPGVNMPMTGSRTCNPTTSVAGPPGTPIMASPQDPASTGSESMYAMMKSVPGGSIPAYMGGGPEPPLPLGAQEAPLVMNDSNPDMDGLPKDNPNDHNPGTPGEGDGQFGNLLPFSQDNDHCESVAILKIKESMQEEARRFENVDETTDHQGEFFMQ
ncbi:single-stranded DNA-binding protein 3-like isoform X6 [Montipora capricornis]